MERSWWNVCVPIYTTARPTVKRIFLYTIFDFLSTPASKGVLEFPFRGRGEKGTKLISP